MTSETKLDDLGIFFGPENSNLARDGILYFLYNCTNTSSKTTTENNYTSIIVNPVNTSKNPELLKKCNMIQNIH